LTARALWTSLRGRMAGGDRIAKEELARIAAAGLLRRLEALRGPAGVEIEVGAERLISFSSNDYLGLASRPELRAALAAGAARWGAGASASRLVVGDFEAHRELERELADFEGAEAAVLFNSGYAANTGIVPALVGEGDAVFSDALNHASLIDGCRLSRARVRVVPHRDVTALRESLRAARDAGARRLLVVTDTVFSMDGSRAPLREIADVCDEHDALLAIDEAHGTGVLGPRGAGLAEALGVSARVDVRMGTLSKAVGVVGAHAVGTRAICELLLNRARPLIFSTALPPSFSVAALAAVAIVRGPEGDALRARLWRNAARFAAGLRALGLPAVEQSAIFPVVLGDPERALKAAAALRERGVLVKPIRPPTVPEGTSRLRFALSAAHTDAHVDQALDALARAL
jgi:8-amino-7-oxononanoate synthase